METTIKIEGLDGKVRDFVQKATEKGRKVGTKYFAPKDWTADDYLGFWGLQKLIDDVVTSEVNGRMIAYTKLALNADGSFDEQKFADSVKSLTTRSRTLNAIMEQIRQLITDLVGAKTTEEKLVISDKLGKLNAEYQERKAKYDEADEADDAKQVPATPVVA